MRTILLAGALVLAVSACQAAPFEQRVPGIEAQHLSECERAELESMRKLIRAERESGKLELAAEREAGLALLIIGTPGDQPLWPEKCRG